MSASPTLDAVAKRTPAPAPLTNQTTFVNRNVYNRIARQIEEASVFTWEQALAIAMWRSGPNEDGRGFRAGVRGGMTA